MQRISEPYHCAASCDSLPYQPINGAIVGHMDAEDLPEQLVERADGHPLVIAGYVVAKYMRAPARDQRALGEEAERRGIEGDLHGMWQCEVCRSRISSNELDMIIGVPDPIPICPTIGCSGAGWERVHPD
jgi:hypothetical protein